MAMFQIYCRSSNWGTNSYHPLGPDSYGYYIYDSEDIDYLLAPTYDWVEIMTERVVLKP